MRYLFRTVDYRYIKVQQHEHVVSSVQGCDSVVILNSFLSNELLITKHFLFLSEAAVYTRILLKSYSKKYSKIHRKRPVTESCFIKICRYTACNVIRKEGSKHRWFLWVLQNFEIQFFNHTAGGWFCSCFFWFTETGFE